MSTKDLFNKNNKILTKSEANKVKKDIESFELVNDISEARTSLRPRVDYSKPENFAKYGSAKKYYEDSFQRIHRTFPYDGSNSEIQKWLNTSTGLDLWIYENIYPRSTGHIKLLNNQSVTAQGGPNKQPGITEGEQHELSKQFPSKQGNSNIWDTSVYRNSNLYMAPAIGNTIEFWAKVDASVNSPFTVFNLISENQVSSLISMTYDPSTGNVTYKYKDDADNGFSSNSVSIPGLISTSWNHIAISFQSVSDKVNVEIYKNGLRIHDVSVGDAMTTVSQSELFLNINGTSNSNNSANGLYIDEFRFWKLRRTEEQIARHWFTNVYGGTNTDDNKYSTETRNVDIGVYYKFNEGIVSDATIDATVLDYSGRISNGTIVNYTETVRSTLSAIDESSHTTESEEKDPIIYPSHPSYISSLDRYSNAGNNYDISNNASVFHTMPAWIIEEDDERGSLKELTQVISSYFDNTHLQIQELTELKKPEYYSATSPEDRASYLVKTGIESSGLTIPDLFTEATALEDILSRNEKSLFEEKLHDIKNTIYQNIYNNLSYIYKSKGTEKAFRNLIRCFGIDDELVRVNLYSDNTDYLLEDTRRVGSTKKNFLDFNSSTRDQAFVETTQDSLNQSSTVSYIKGARTNWKNLSATFETELMFPGYMGTTHPEYAPPTNTVENIASIGVYSSGYTSTELWNLTAIKEDNNPYSKNLKFRLEMEGQTLDTPYFKDVYGNSKWNVAVRVKPKSSLPLGTQASSLEYGIELYCLRTTADTIEEEILVSATVTTSGSYLSSDKYLRLGKVVADTSKSLKVSSTLFWYDYLSNDEIKAHASDSSNYGRLNPTERVYSHLTTLEGIPLTRMDTLALHWDFNNITTSDGSGQALVQDLSEGIPSTSLPLNSKAIQFDGDITAGQTDHVLVSDSDDFSFTSGAGTDTQFSISAWVYVDDIATDNGPFVSKALVQGAGVDITEYIFKHVNGKLRTFLYNPDGTGKRITLDCNSAVLSSQTWHHVALTYDASKNSSGLSFYVDGVEIVATNTNLNSGVYTGMSSTSHPLIIGKTVNDPPTAGQAFEDKMADVCIFSKELSSEEVVELYNSGSVKNMEDHSAYADIISWWKMGDDQDTTGADGIKDYVGTHHGTLTNGATIVDEVNLPTDNLVSGRFGWFTGLISKQVSGLAQSFNSNDNQIINKEYIYSAKHRTPEVINSEDLVHIKRDDEEPFTRDTRPVRHFFSAEKGMYQIINDDIINLFATVKEFNNLIGQPVNRYRMSYKSLRNFNQKYFEKVKNVPSLEKYVEYYKWIDSSIGLMLRDLIPISSNFSSSLRTMVESHVLERNKYWTKFPTLEMSGTPPEGQIRGINELTYNWNLGHAPLPGQPESESCVWIDQRVERTDAIVAHSGVNGLTSVIDTTREMIRGVQARVTKGLARVVERNGINVEETLPILRDNAGAVYEGNTHTTQALSKPYKFVVESVATIHAGANSTTTGDPIAFIRSATKITTGTSGIILTSNAATPTCPSDSILQKDKRSQVITITDSEAGTSSSMTGLRGIYPHYSSSAGSELTNIHGDTYGDDAEIPMQGMFTETHVGGNQHRHTHFTEQTPSDRPEFYLNDAGTLRHPQEVNSDYPAARYTRDEVAKRPVNIRNIKSTTINNTPLGNYQRNYEVVQTSGRTQNNRFFVKNEGVSQNSVNSAFISGTADFTLPDRTQTSSGASIGRTEHVFVERFSAPGDPLTLSRGYLDPFAEEYSVYNSMNFRNLDERLEHHKRLYTHSGLYNGSQGYEDTTNGVPSIHKINRNSYYHPRLTHNSESGSYFCEFDHDNAYISHQIPRSDMQYAFAHGSVDKTAYEGTEVLNCDGVTTPARFSGYYDDVVVMKGDELHDAPYSDYQAAGWRFIRNGEKAEVARTRRQNTISVLDRAPATVFRAHTTSSHIEPAVVWHKPLRHDVTTSGEVIAQIDEDNFRNTDSRLNDRQLRFAFALGNKRITHTYSNNLEIFSNPNLMSKLDLKKSQVQYLDEILEEIRRGDTLYQKITMTELIYPKRRNVGLAKTRDRKMFDSYKVFWRDKFFDRVKKKNIDTTKLGFKISDDFRKMFQQQYSVDSMDNFFYKQEQGGTETTFQTIGDLQSVGEQRHRYMITRSDVAPLNSYAGSRTGLEGFSTVSGAANPPLYPSEVVQNKAPIPSIQLYYSSHSFAKKQSQGWLNRKPKLSQAPTYDNYYDFSEDNKLAGQNYGIVSEFRASEHMDKYIFENGGDFTVKNYNFLTLDGASHDGTTHTRTSGLSDTETAVFYSISPNNKSLEVTSYPTSTSDNSISANRVVNNSPAFSEFNKIFTPSTVQVPSTFDISNSINTEIEIIQDPSAIIPVSPMITGKSAAGIFNRVNTDNDFLVIEVDNFSSSAEAPIADDTEIKLISSADTDSDGLPNGYVSDPFTMSIWAQPEASNQVGDFDGIFSMGRKLGNGSVSESINLLSRYTLANAQSGYGNLGLTFVASTSNTDGFTTFESAPGEADEVGNTCAYTFFKADGSPATLIDEQFNHVVLQIIPPALRVATTQHLIRIWLNGEQLYGVPVLELLSSRWATRQGPAIQKELNAYNPCPIGRNTASSGDEHPWLLDYDHHTNGDSGIYGITFINRVILGNANFHDSIDAVDNFPTPGTFDKKFHGLLDEFNIFRGILNRESIKQLYGEGKPSNTAEQVSEFSGNTLVNSVDTGEFSFLPPLVKHDYTNTPHHDPNDNLAATIQNRFLDYYNTNTDDQNGPKIVKYTSGFGLIISQIGLVGTKTPHNSVVDPPGSAGNYYRWVELEESFEEDISVAYSIYAGDAASPWADLSDTPANSEVLRLQYKLDDGNWTTSSTYSVQDISNPINTQVAKISDISVGQTPDNKVKLRWISESSNVVGDSHWGIDNVRIQSISEGVIVLDSTPTFAPIIEGTLFKENWTVAMQQSHSDEASLPVWHRIGIPSYDNIEGKCESWDDEFFNSYVHTNHIPFIEEVTHKQSSLGVCNTTQRVRLRVNAKKKLLPYEGFYPQDRTVQIAELFVKKIKDETPGEEKANKNQSIQAIMQHFFAPGILYNSLKAGIACDWASFTNESGLEPSYYGDTIQATSSSAEVELYLDSPAPYWYQANMSETTMNPLSSIQIPAQTAPSRVSTSPIHNNNTSSLNNLLGASAVDPLFASPLAKHKYVYNFMIAQNPTKRLPFEAILDPVNYLKSTTSEETHSIGAYSVAKKPDQYFLMTPEYYSLSGSFSIDIVNNPGTAAWQQNGLTNYDKYVYPSFDASQMTTADSRYEMAIHNFMAEIPRFFLKNKTLNTFTSDEEKNFKNMSSGTTYYMDVVVGKTKQGFSPVYSPSDSGASYFGPATKWKEDLDGISDLTADPAYAPYVPPYFYGSSVARIKFVPPLSGSNKYTLQDILDNSTVETASEAKTTFQREAGNTAFENSPSWESMMPVSSSINLFSTTNKRQVAFAANSGVPLTVTDSTTSDSSVWAIYPRFECPILNFLSEENTSTNSNLEILNFDNTLQETTTASGFSYSASYLDTTNDARWTSDYRTGAGLWAGIGEQRQGVGAFLTIKESFAEGTENIGSLIDVCGFQPETRQLGVIADEREIKEAVVMIPFLDKALIENRSSTSESVPTTPASEVPVTIKVDDRHFIRVDRAEYDEQKRRLDAGIDIENPAYELKDIPGKLDQKFMSSSITKMITGMREYNLPPRYDFEMYEQAPFAMYFFEFTHTLDKEDLQNIWQGMPPKIAKRMTHDFVEVEHDINEHELFGHLNEVPKDIRWMVFKVKKKAAQNYYELTADSTDDTKFKFNFDVGEKPPEYSYNYPYDFFTMLERIQVEAKPEVVGDPVQQFKKKYRDDR